MVNRDFQVILFFPIAFKEFQLTNEVIGNWILSFLLKHF